MFQKLFLLCLLFLLISTLCMHATLHHELKDIDEDEDFKELFYRLREEYEHSKTKHAKKYKKKTA